MRANTIGGVLLAAALAAGCGGTGTEGTCGTYPACGGGNPQGHWTLTAGCMNLVNTPFQQPSLPDQLMQPQTITEAPPQPQPTTSGDWCSNLVYEPTLSPAMPVRGVVLWHSPPVVHDGFVNLEVNGTFDAHIRFINHEFTHFDSACLTRYDTPKSCMQLGIDLAAYEHSQPGFMFGTTDNMGNVDASNVCTGDPLTTGCDCHYDYQGQAGEMGTWGLSDATTIVLASMGMTEPQAASYCLTGGALQLTGFDGASLFAAQGLRSAQFVPVQ
jgi:hypothetical protein